MKSNSAQSQATRSRLAAPFAVLVVVCLLSACADIPLPGVYRIDIQQGNVITQEQLAALEAGMEKRKVRFILGTPLVTDTFNQQRWDYYYSLEQSGEDRVQRIVSVFFDGERLSHVNGDVRAATGPIKLPERADTVIPVPEGYRDQGIFASLTPSFISGKPKLRPSDDGDKEAEKDSPSSDTEQAPRPAAEAGDAAASATASADPTSNETRNDVEINAEDESYLRDLLGGFGTAGDEQPEQSAGSESAANAEAEEEGLFSRWAKRLGWGNEPETAGEGDDATQSPSPTQ